MPHTRGLLALENAHNDRFKMFKTEKNGDYYTTCRVQWVGIHARIGVTAAQYFSKG